MQSRWGSLSRAGTMTLNVNLVRAPHPCIAVTGAWGEGGGGRGGGEGGGGGGGGGPFLIAFNKTLGGGGGGGGGKGWDAK